MISEFSASCIVYEDDDVIVVDKPVGVSCQAVDPAVPDDLPSRLKRFLARRRGVPESEVYLGIHQRLDQATSGLVLYTLRKEANASIASQFEERTIEKTYLAAVSGSALPTSERLLEHHLAPGRDGRMEVTQPSDRRSKLARTRIRVLQRVADRALLEARIETGRTHQIRVQLAAIGAPVAGDALYGKTPALRQLLHAQKLVFSHPSDGRRIQVNSAAGLEFQDWLTHGARPAYCDPHLLQRAFGFALESRAALLQAHAAGETTAFRLLHDAADGFPGLALEVFDRWLVLRLTGEVSEAAVQATLDAASQLGFAGTYLKRHPKQASDIVDPRDERIAPPLPVRGEPAPEVLTVFEHGMPFEVRLHDGLRTGLFLDQRDNRQRVRALSAGLSVLNLFAYSGSFSVAALSGGAPSVTSVDVSRAALAWAARNVERLGHSERHRTLAQDAFDALARLAAKQERFDFVIVDPPSYSTTKRGRFRVTKDYGDLLVAALAVLADRGILLACLNHHGVSQGALRRFVHEAAQAAGFGVESLKDVSAQRDFPPEAGAEPLAKSVLARLSRPAAL